MIVCQEIDFNEPLTDSQVKMLHKLAERCKQTVTLRLSPQALKKAKSLGKGYTSILSRILENALDNPDIIQHNL